MTMFTLCISANSVREGCAMESRDWPCDPVANAALVVRVVDDLDASSEEQRDALLCELLCAAWGSILAQNQ